MSDLFKDDRFNHIGTDPRFKNVPKSERKIKIDKRFQSIFSDKKFQLKYAVDIRGRPVRESQADNYKKYYDISSDSDNSSDSETEPVDESKNDSRNSNNEVEINEKDVSRETTSHIDSKSKTKPNEKNKVSSKKISKAIDEIHKTKINDMVHGRLQDMSTDYARGIGTIMSDSSSDDSSSDESDFVFVEHLWGELDKDVETTEKPTRRLAICHLDWDNIYAKDIMMLLHSFLPADGIIESVSIYPSEFGIERMKEEELKGPKELVEVSNHEEEDENEESEGKDYHMEKLREYQINRLKYYYAVVVCNDVETANKLYTECNDKEYESCAAKIDMRFIPDDMTFEQEPREICTNLPDISKYTPRLFENSALRHGKVSLTWDETDPRRIEFNKRIVSGEMNDEDINVYIASSSEESEKETFDVTNSCNSDSEKEDNEPTNKLSKYRSLIATLKSEEEKKKNKDVEMEICWGAGVKENKKSNVDNKDGVIKSKPSVASNKLNENESDDDSSTDDELHLKSKKLQGKFKKKPINETLSDEEKRNAELDLLLTEDVFEENKKQHFSLKQIQKEENESKSKKKRWRKELKKKINANKEEDNFKVDVTDSRFSALYTSHLYNIDPAHHQFKKTKAMDEFIGEKQKRRKLLDEQNMPALNNKNKKNEL